MKLKGRVWKFGDDINTDEIIPAPLLVTTDANELGKHCMSGIDKSFVSKISKRDIIAAGENFGCGSSREHAPLAIKGAGISCVIAKSFARIFFRNAVNIGLLIFESDCVDKLHQGDEISVDTNKGVIVNVSRKENFLITPLPDFLQSIISAGGLMKWVKKLQSS